MSSLKYTNDLTPLPIKGFIGKEAEVYVSVTSGQSINYAFPPFRIGMGFANQPAVVKSVVILWGPKFQSFQSAGRNPQHSLIWPYYLIQYQLGVLFVLEYCHFDCFSLKSDFQIVKSIPFNPLGIS